MKPSADGHGEKSAENTETAADGLLDRWSCLAKESSLVDPTLYVEYDVKRGLRDVYGHGVLAGLTQIGDVVGAAADGDILVPIPGQLIYRGISITELVNGFVAEDRLGFEETCYLILFGELPNEAELALFHDWVATHRVLPKRFVHDAILRMPSRDIMNAMSRNVLALYVLDENPDDISIINILQQSLRLISTFPVLAVYAYRAYVHHFQDRSLVIRSPLAELSTAENILRMLRPDNQYSKLEAMVLDLTLVLHAEHGGGNNSSFTAHVVSSSGTDTYATIAAALGSLKGPRHGGANIKAVQMFEEIKGEVKDWEDDDEVENYLLRMLNKDAFDRSGLIYGMGHPVYSISDPRTLILKQFAERLAQEKGLEGEYRLHEKVEELAPAAIAKSRRMYKGVSANVDFYSGFVYSMLNIPPELFTPLFAVSRIVGWCAHRIEEISNSGKIIRPAYKSVAPRRVYVPLDDR
ncbi:MAG: citrate/2-methylcitrate synthase [Actinomycetota bacterium]|nr:citrate/2-methylcitrate synthase [Actinomycetota bacterium]